MVDFSSSTLLDTFLRVNLVESIAPASQRRRFHSCRRTHIIEDSEFSSICPDWNFDMCIIALQMTAEPLNF